MRFFGSPLSSTGSDTIRQKNDLRKLIQSGRTRMTSKEVLESLCALPDRPWASAVRASPCAFNWLARQLRPLGIASHNIRLGAQRAKGYDLSDFAAVFARFLNDGAQSSSGAGAH